MARRWIVSSRSRGAAAWSVPAVALFVGVAGWTIADVVREVSVPSVVLAAIVTAAALVAVIVAGQSVSAGFVRLDDDGYATPLGTPRRWADVLAVGRVRREGAVVPAVAVRSGEGFPIAHDTFTAFTDADADALLAEVRARAPHAVGDFGAVDLPAAWWAEVEAEAARIRGEVEAASGRLPVAQRRVEFGYPGLTSAILLDYGRNDAGEGVEVVVRRSPDLALVRDGVRYLRQARKKTPDAAAEVGVLFDAHTTEILPGTDLAWPQAVVTAEGRRPLRFNAEEPDLFETAV